MSRTAYLLDALVVLVFAAAGRASHDLDGDVLGVLTTAWPFLVGMASGWAVVRLLPLPLRRWWAEGLFVVGDTFVIGMALRWITGGGTALPFVLVAAGVLTAGMLGWRLVEDLLSRRRRAA